VTADQPWLLLVEDSPHDRELAVHALSSSRLPGRVEQARDGVEALDLLFCRGRWASRDRSDQPVVVLLDVKMPMVSGIEVLRELKSDPNFGKLPIVMVTSSAEDADLAACYALGANSYIVKPVNIEDFFATMRDIGRYWMVLNRPPQENHNGMDAFAVADR
jgi:two-component system response regulator